MSHTHDYQASEFSYDVHFRATTEPKMAQRRRLSSTRRRHKSPQAFNGIHRRRLKKFSW
jgi:hypothetical protein